MLGLIDGVSLKLLRLDRARSSTVARGRQPPALLPLKLSKSVTDHAGLKCYRSSRSLTEARRGYPKHWRGSQTRPSVSEKSAWASETRRES